MKFEWWQPPLMIFLVIVASIYFGVKKHMGKFLILVSLIAAMYWHENISNYFNGAVPTPVPAKAVVVGAPHSNNQPVISSGNMGQMADQAKAQANAASGVGHPVLLTEEEKGGITKWLIDHTPSKSK